MEAVIYSKKNSKYWGAVFALSLSAFALVSSEFMPVSLLTPVAKELGISEGFSGLAITVSAAFALLTSLFISGATHNIDRRKVLHLLVILMIFSGIVVTLSPNFSIFLAGRALIGISIGGFWSMSAATAMRLVPEKQVPRALAVVNGGNALATVIAAPLGSFFGSIIGWRGAFMCLVPIAVIALFWLYKTLPKMESNQQERTQNVFSLMRKKNICFGMLAVSIFFMGQFSLYTYIRPFLENITLMRNGTISFVLLGLGLSGLVGTFVIGFFLKKNLFIPLITIPLIMSAIAIILQFYGVNVWICTSLFIVWGLVATAAPVGWWTWVASSLPDNAEAGGGLMVAIIQLAITIGSATGGIAFDHSGYHATFTISAVLLILSSFLTVVSART